MRFTKAELPMFCKQAISTVVPKYPNLMKMDMDFMEDLMFVIAQGRKRLFQYLCSVYDLAVETTRLYSAGKIIRMAQYEAELYKMRLDLIDFANSGFCQLLHADPLLKLEEKFELVCMILNELFDSRNMPNDMKNDMKAAAGTAGQSAGNALAQQAAQASGGQSPAMSKADIAMTSNFFKGFSFLANYLYDIAPKQGGTAGDMSSRGASSFAQMLKESFETKQLISRMVSNLWNNSYIDLFHIALNIDMSFERAKKGILKDTDHVASNVTFGKMRQMRDLVHAMPMELAFDDVLDRKIMNKSLKVTKYRERREQKQCLYALLDGSGSMDKRYTNGLTRIHFVKAMAIALGKKAIRDKSVFYFRWFRGGVKDVYILKSEDQWEQFLKHILDESANGSTDIDFALHTAIKDVEHELDGMDKSDLIVITDGTQDIANADEFAEIKRKKGLKYHFVGLEDFSDSTRIQQIAETFQIVDADRIENFESYKPAFRKVI